MSDRGALLTLLQDLRRVADATPEERGLAWARLGRTCDVLIESIEKDAKRERRQKLKAMRDDLAMAGTTDAN